MISFCHITAATTSHQWCHKYTVCKYKYIGGKYKYKYKYSETLRVQVQVQVLAKFTSTSTEFQVQVRVQVLVLPIKVYSNSSQWLALLLICFILWTSLFTTNGRRNKRRKKWNIKQTNKQWYDLTILTILTTVYNCVTITNKRKTFSLHWYWNILACSYYT